MFHLMNAHKSVSLFLAGLLWVMEGCMVRLHSVHFRGALSAQPIIVNFHELFQTRDAPTILPMVNMHFYLILDSDSYQMTRLISH